jgi:ubiquinone/menaquinone biosynthesis C-methylase UbiE
MRRLEHVHELQDGPLDDAGTLRGNLRDLARVNRLLGGLRLSAWGIQELVGDQPGARVLDVGTGAADIPRALAGRWMFTAVDSRPEVIAQARSAAPGGAPGVELAVADGTALPWPDDAFHVGHLSLVLHHLEPLVAVTLLRELRRVARLGVVVNDLDRARVYWLGATLLGRVATRNRFTRRDGPMSVQRAYTVREVGALLRVAGLRPIAVRRAFFGHRYAIVAVPAAGNR